MTLSMTTRNNSVADPFFSISMVSIDNWIVILENDVSPSLHL